MKSFEEEIYDMYESEEERVDLRRFVAAFAMSGGLWIGIVGLWLWLR